MNDYKKVNEAIFSGVKMLCVPVTEIYVEEMRDCVPPAYMSYKDPYNIIQCGEPYNHNSDGEPQYMTYIRMTEGIPENMRDSRMEINQWYFVGVKKQVTQ